MRAYEKWKRNNDVMYVHYTVVPVSGFRLYPSDLRESEKIPLFYSGVVLVAFFFFFVRRICARVTVVTAAAAAVVVRRRRFVLCPPPHTRFTVNIYL